MFDSTMTMRSRYLASFSGVFGDILWSLPTVKDLADQVGEPLDFVVMPAHASLVPLLQAQPYINLAAAVPDWHCVHTSWGAQPWYPPERIEEGYERVWHLGYRSPPQTPLVDLIAAQQGLRLSSPVPFIFVEGDRPIQGPYVMSGIGNPQDYHFMQVLREMLPEIPILVSITMPWLEAARHLKHATAFIGSRSSNYVLSHGVGLGRIIVYEQDSPRRHPNFACPHHGEVLLPYAPNGKDDRAAAETQAALAAQIIREGIAQ